MTKLRLAIVGAGPAGIYAADIILKAERKFDVSIDLFEQLPAPYGLVRYGVAPDHPRIKGIITALREVLDRGDIRLFGNVRFGEDITLDDLKHHYNAVIFATGAIRDSDLDIPGIDAVGSYGAADFVSWFDGHPDVPREWPLDAASVAVIGNGNVALDVARMLAKHAEDLLPTEIPDNVHAGLAASPVTDVHVFGRRGPAQVKFTPLELRELGELRDVDMVVYDEDFDYDEASQGRDRQQQAGHGHRPRAAVVAQAPLGQQRRRHGIPSPAPALLREAARGAHGRRGPRRPRFRWERTRPDGEGGVVGTGEIREVPIQALYRAVGYFGSPLPGVPFDERHGVIPNHEGQVLQRRLERARLGRLRDRLDQARTGRAHRPHQVRRDGDRPPHHQRPGRRGGSRRDPSEAAIPALLAERGVAWTDLERLAPPRRARDRARRAARARAHQGRPARRDGAVSRGE